MENTKKVIAAVASAAVAAPLGWFFPMFAFACAGAFLVAAAVYKVASRSRPQFAVAEPMDAMLVVPVRPGSHRRQAA